MKSPAELLLTKELELQKVKREVEALRIAARLLMNEKEQPKVPLPQRSTRLLQLR